MATALQIQREQRIERRFYRMIHSMGKFDRNRQTASSPEKIRYWARKRTAIYKKITDTIHQLHQFG